MFSVRRCNRDPFFEDRLGINVNALSVIAPSGNVKNHWQLLSLLTIRGDSLTNFTPLCLRAS